MLTTGGFANDLRAWITVDDAGQIIGSGYSGGGLIGDTLIRLGGLRHTFQNALLPDLRSDPEHGDGWVRFTQTCGGKTGVPQPRRVAHRPFVQWQAPTAWTTLSLTLHADGHAELDVPGASRFPRHWVYDAGGKLARKSGLTDFSQWYRKSFGKHTPWGDEDSPALVVAVETALERQLSVHLMHGGAKPRIENFPAGATLVQQGQPGTSVYLVLDGIVRVEPPNGDPIATRFEEAAQSLPADVRGEVGKRLREFVEHKLPVASRRKRFRRERWQRGADAAARRSNPRH